MMKYPRLDTMNIKFDVSDKTVSCPSVTCTLYTREYMRKLRDFFSAEIAYINTKLAQEGKKPLMFFDVDKFTGKAVYKPAPNEVNSANIGRQISRLKAIRSCNKYVLNEIDRLWNAADLFLIMCEEKWNELFAYNRERTDRIKMLAAASQRVNEEVIKEQDIVRLALPTDSIYVAFDPTVEKEMTYSQAKHIIESGAAMLVTNQMGLLSTDLFDHVSHVYVKDGIYWLEIKHDQKYVTNDGWVTITDTTNLLDLWKKGVFKAKNLISNDGFDPNATDDMPF